VFCVFGIVYEFQILNKGEFWQIHLRSIWSSEKEVDRDDEWPLVKSNESLILDLSADRLNKLFDILHDKERKYSSVMKNLQLFMFEDLVSSNNKPKANDEQKMFPNETSEFLKVLGNRVRVTNKYLNYLNNITEFYSFKSYSTLNMTKRQIEKVNLIFI
jgi:hypothetical protein